MLTSAIGTEDVIIPIVAECDDSFLSDPRRMQVTAADVAAALAAARQPAGQPPLQGAVGAGTGMSCLGYKGGIGTASRVLPSGHTVGVLLLANFGERERLTIDGLPAMCTPPASASEHSPERSAWLARCSATSVDEQAVSTVTAGPSRPSE